MDRSQQTPRAALRRWPVLAGVAAAGLVLLASSPRLQAGSGLGGPLVQPGPLLWGVLVVLGGLLLQRYSLAALAVLLLAVPGWAFVEAPHRITTGQLLPAAVGLTYVVATRPRRTGGLVAALTFVAVVVLEYGAERGPTAEGRVLPLALAVVVAWLVGDLVRQNRRQAAEARVHATEQAVAAERLRIARELHDLVAHSIGIIAIQAGAGRRVIGTRPDAAEEALAAIESTSRETLAGLRRALGALRQADPGADPEAGLRAPAPGLDDVEQLAEATSVAGVRVLVERQGAPRLLPPDVDLAAFRIVQEAVTNVVRHSGAASCTVRITLTGDAVELEVTDGGRGLPPGGELRPGFGLTGMRERVSLLAGTFEAAPRPQGGFRVMARLPLDGATS